LLIQPLSAQTSAPELRSALARIHLQSGNLAAAREHFAQVDADLDAPPSLKAMNGALLASAEGNWARAAETLRGIVGKGADSNFVAINNMAVALLAQGKLSGAIEVLEHALGASPSSVVVAEPFLFNLCAFLVAL
jgi:tetratricopeptide (TPR) repeat protein